MSIQQIAPSILSADFSCLGEEVKAIELAGANRVHVDIMDGCFVPNLTMGALVVKSLKKVSNLPLDIHLMIQKPESKIHDFSLAGADSITVHIESTKNPKNILSQIRKNNVLAGLTLKPNTPIQTLFPFLHQLDLVLIMTVEPGLGGQSLLLNQLPKIIAIKKEISRQNLNIPVHVDGGVNSQTVSLLSEADVLVSGNFIFKHKSYKEAIALLKNRICTT